MSKVEVLSNSDIFSSTGGLGVSRRPFDRLYVNGTHFSSNSKELVDNWQRLEIIGERHANKIGRVIFRGLVSDEAIQQILEDRNLSSRLEVALPVKDFTGESSWLVYLAKNRADRTQIESTKTMVEATTVYREVLPPDTRVLNVISAGGSFIDRFSEDQIDQLYSLWGGTFGWERNQIDNFRTKIDSFVGMSPSKKSVWFSGVIKDWQIVAAAMAERLPIPGANGSKLDLVESTEWRTRPGYEGQHLMTSTLDMLNAQVMADLRDDGESRIPLIYAECNFQSRSDRAGHGTGLLVPSRNVYYRVIPQILFQNVGVEDGHLEGQNKLRDFTFTYLHPDVIKTYYNPEQVREMLMLMS
jgi:hypothetical protein